MSDYELTIKGEVEALHLQPGDVIVVTCERKITQAQAVALHEQCAEVFPGHKVVILPPELRLNLQREEVAA